MASETGKLFSFHNVGLFSDHFLSKRLPAESPLWTNEKVTTQTARRKDAKAGAPIALGEMSQLLQLLPSDDRFTNLGLEGT